MNFKLRQSGQSCGATISNFCISRDILPHQTEEIRNAWLKHKVLAFEDQVIDDDCLEAFTIAMGGFGEDPFFSPIPGRKHIASIKREADEKSPLFAENWHSDWSFLQNPPAGTCLLAIDIPSKGGDTLFANQAAAFEDLPSSKKDFLRGLNAIHSAQLAYAPEGTYGEKDYGRSMEIHASERARETQVHPLVKRHPETGEEVIFSTLGYIIGIEGFSHGEAIELLSEIADHQTQEKYIYRQKWEPGMLVMWDNRSLLHKATGGYEGKRRELHRTTIAAFQGII